MAQHPKGKPNPSKAPMKILHEGIVDTDPNDTEGILDKDPLK